MMELLIMGEGGFSIIDAVKSVIEKSDLSQLSLKTRQNLLIDVADIDWLAPVPLPGKIICIAGNYPSLNNKEKPEYPIVFVKPSTTVTAHRKNIPLPVIADHVSYEVELALIVGRLTHNIKPEKALDHLAGITIANDLGDQMLEKRCSQWVSGKMFNGFTPMGPYLVTLDEVNDLNDLNLKTELNTTIVQLGNTAEMFYKTEVLVSYLSTLTTLYPGDVILTGSPKLFNGKGVPVNLVKPYDHLNVSIENIGMLSNNLIQE